jgi:uncharacterized membrane protein
VPTRKILIAGETWVSNKVEVKGFSAYSTSSYGIGLTELVEALEQSGHEVTHIPNHEAIEAFPWDVAAASSYDVIMLSDIAADTLQIHPDCFDHGKRTPDRLRVLADYTAAGGGLIMVGGYMSFSGIEGKAHYQATPLARVLPVGMLGYDDRMETCEGVVPKVEREHEVLAGIAGEWPFFLGYNQLTAKPDAELVMSIEGDPFLVLGRHGDGRTAAFASDCSPHWGSPEFLAWEHYARFWGQLVDWLGANAISESSGS